MPPTVNVLWTSTTLVTIDSRRGERSEMIVKIEKTTQPSRLITCQSLVSCGWSYNRCVHPCLISSRRQRHVQIYYECSIIGMRLLKIKCVTSYGAITVVQSTPDNVIVYK